MDKTSLDLSPVHIVAHADPIVQAVIAFLIAASVLSWSIILSRSIRFTIERRRIRELNDELAEIASPQDLVNLCKFSNCSAARVLSSIGEEWDWSSDNPVRTYDAFRARILSIIDLSVARESGRVAGRTSLLATIGSTAPFVGLFGTVWGIMRSFISIGQTLDTSLAVVAPGIAEALMATAIGLFCAIPAVIGYNRLLGGLSELEVGWRTLAGQIEVAISRQFELGQS